MAAGDYGKTLSEDLKDLKNIAGDANRVFDALDSRYKQLSKSSGKIADRFKDTLDLGKDLLKNTKNIFDVDLKSHNLSRQMANAKNKRERDYIRSLDDELKLQQAIQSEGLKQVDTFNKQVDSVVNLINKIPIVGDLLGGPVSMLGGTMKEAFSEGLGTTLADAGNDGTDVLKDLSERGKNLKQIFMKGAQVLFSWKGALVAGLSVFGKIVSAAREFGVSFTEVIANPRLIFFSGQVSALAEEFGNLQTASASTLLSMKLMSLTTGVTAENQAKIMSSMAATSDSSMSALRAQMASYKQAGIPFRMIMEDVAGSTEFFAKFGQDGGDNIFKAAIRARELGVNLGEVENITESILNFESSIESQMKASVLLGRTINLDRARQLAFAGKQSEMMDEVLKQVGSEAEFNKMNFIQRKAVADAVGMTTGGLSKLIREEEKVKSGFVALLPILGGIAGLIVGIGSVIRSTIGGAGAGLAFGLKQFATVGKFATLGYGLGFAGSKTFGDFVQRPGQAPTEFNPNDTVVGVRDPSALGGGLTQKQGDQIIALLQTGNDGTNALKSEVRSLGLGSV